MDDVTLLTPTSKELQDAFLRIDLFLALTDQKLNVDKTYVFGVHTGKVDIVFKSKPLHSKAKVKILGFKFHFVENGVRFFYENSDLEFLSPACARVRSAGLLFGGRALVAGGAIMSKLLYACEIRQLSDSSERNIRSVITSTLWESNSLKRSPGILNTVFVKGHVLDVMQASLLCRWIRYTRAIRNDPSVARVVWHNATQVHRGKLRHT